MNSTIEYLDIFDLLLPVEKHPLKDEYILVGKYDCYNFITNNPHIKQIPVLLKILQKNLHNTSKYFVDFITKAILIKPIDNLF